MCFRVSKDFTKKLYEHGFNEFGERLVHKELDVVVDPDVGLFGLFAQWNSSFYLPGINKLNDDKFDHAKYEIPGNANSGLYTALDISRNIKKPKFSYETSSIDELSNDYHAAVVPHNGVIHKSLLAPGFKSDFGKTFETNMAHKYSLSMLVPFVANRKFLKEASDLEEFDFSIYDEINGNQDLTANEVATFHQLKLLKSTYLHIKAMLSKLFEIQLEIYRGEK